MTSQFIEMFKAGKGVVGIVGMGYVGLPLALRFSDVNVKVVGLDVDPEKVNALMEGKSYIHHISEAAIRKARAAGFTATTSPADFAHVDAILICVPTPLGVYREPDLSYIQGTMTSLKPYLRKGQLISLESTTYPGTTEEEIVTVVESLGLKVGQDIFVVFSPEREDPGNAHFNTQSIPKVIGGVTKNCLEAGLTVYEKAIDKLVPVSSTRAAELTKLLENIHRSVNIGLMNEMKIIAHKMDIDLYEVIKAAATKPFGFTPYYPGPGLGGHCIPIDPFYLTWKAREYGVHTRFIELAGEINSAMPDYVISRLSAALNDRSKSIHGSKILVLGVAYKKNIDDMRESPSMEILEHLIKLGASVEYSDPYVKKLPKMRKHDLKLSSLALNETMLPSYDAVLLATDHDSYDYAMIEKASQLIIDTRGRFDLRNKKVVSA